MNVPVTISVNGAPREILNETVVPRTQWPSTALSEGDRVEILTAVQGG
jgi:sulfur carrier protein